MFEENLRCLRRAQGVAPVAAWRVSPLPAARWPRLMREMGLAGA